jgi:hypothetical protein
LSKNGKREEGRGKEGIRWMSRSVGKINKNKKGKWAM